MSGKLKKWLVFGGAGVAVVVAVFGYRASRSSITYETETVSRGTVIEEVSLTGSITAAKKIALQPEVSGKVAAIAVKVGAEVKTGDLLLEIDSRDLQSRISSQRAAVDSARARLSELVAGATPQELALAEAAVATAVSRRDAAVAAKSDAETSLVNAQKNYDNVVAKAETLLDSKRSTLVHDLEQASSTATDAIVRLTSPMFTPDDQLTFSTTSGVAETDARNTRRDARAALPQISAAVSDAKDGGAVEDALSAETRVSAGMVTVKTHVEADVELLKYALGLDAATKSSYQLNANTALASVDASLQSVAASRSNLELQQKLNDADITSAQIAVSNARSALNAATYAIETAERSLAQADADLLLKKSGNRAEVIAAQRARVAAEVATLGGLLTDLSKRKILAPLDGIVTDVPVEVGETVLASQVVVSLNAQDKFEITANISEVDIAMIEVGQPVAITLDAFPTTEKWSGKVVTVYPAERVVEGVIFYETKIVFDEEDPRLKSGMTANLDIETARSENALRVPVRAVRERSGKEYVQVVVDGQAVDRDVEIGLEGVDFVEIKSGLSEGESVVISTNGTK